MECPKNNEWEMFRHQSHSQIEDDGKEENYTATTILEVTEITVLVDMDKDIMEKISRYDPKRDFTMFRTIVDEDSVSLSQTTESEQDNSFLGFQNCIKSCQQFSGEAFNLSNVPIPKK